ncbi:MAG: Ni/Fe hydrogenase subunit alpha [Gemmataceae bacterium]|nr:Ni/Fe hydrogenase subunit alpha [Gemmata sp.]MDW8196849.1 Ni/Fe hydrogenase subunit alpha [Gemmataceae bacterium]
MAESRTIRVDALTRVEGEGALTVVVRDGQVIAAELNIYEPPRFFEAFLRGRAVREVTDIVARICGICPVAYQMSAAHALEKALGLTLPPGVQQLRRLLYCGEWIESHALHVYMLHAPDFLGFDSGIAMAARYRDAVERGLRMKKIGNRILEVLGGRAVHPINVTVGGFYRAPRVADIQALLPDLRWGRQAAVETFRWATTFDFPHLDIDYDMVSLHHADEYPMNHGNIVSSRGLNIAPEEYETHFTERHEPHTTALQSVKLPEATPYLVGPLARVNLCFDQLSPTARREAEAARMAWPCRNSFQSILARSLEMITAFDEAIRLAETYHVEPQPPRSEPQLRPGEGCHATEAPRGLLYHRFRIGDDGLIAAAKIVPPTAQNQRQIEHDLAAFLPRLLHADDSQIARHCEHLIRNYDPCISCATHFLRVKIERQ